MVIRTMQVSNFSSYSAQHQEKTMPMRSVDEVAYLARQFSDRCRRRPKPNPDPLVPDGYYHRGSEHCVTTSAHV